MIQITQETGSIWGATLPEILQRYRPSVPPSAGYAAGARYTLCQVCGSLISYSDRGKEKTGKGGTSSKDTVIAITCTKTGRLCDHTEWKPHHFS
jgi:hypothetical protein